MNVNKYMQVYSELDNLDDVKRLHKKYRISEDVLDVILDQKLVRKTKKNYYRIKKQAPDLEARWSKGHTFLELAEEADFPPVLVASFVLGERGVTKKRFRDYLNDIESIENARVRGELGDAMRHELVYSPERTKEQRQRGLMVEEHVQVWLEKRSLTFITEKEAKGKHTKTPDFLLKKPIHVDEKRIVWVECKATFGDDYEIRKDVKKQLKHYVELFGEGMVVYWYGFTPKVIKDVLMKSRVFFS